MSNEDVTQDPAAKPDRKAEYEAAKAAKAAEKEAKKLAKSAGKAEKTAGNDSAPAEKQSRGGVRGRGRKADDVDPANTSMQTGGAVAGSSALENRREIPTSTYDLLNGSFGASTKSRTTGLIIGGLMAMLVGYFLLQGVTATFQASSVDAQIAAAAKDRQAILERFGTATGLVGVSDTELIERERAYSTAMRQAISQQPDISTTLNEIRQFAGVGVTITSVDITRSDLIPDPTAKSTDEPVSPAIAAKKGSTYIITLTGQGNDFTSVVRWSESMRGVASLWDLSFTRLGLGVTMVAKVRSSVPAPAASLLSSLGIPVLEGATDAQGADATDTTDGSTTPGTTDVPTGTDTGATTDAQTGTKP